MHMDIETFPQCNNCATFNVWQVGKRMILFEQELWITTRHLASMGDSTDLGTMHPPMS